MQCQYGPFTYLDAGASKYALVSQRFQVTIGNLVVLRLVLRSVDAALMLK